jgi:hypothetical protein
MGPGFVCLELSPVFAERLLDDADHAVGAKVARHRRERHLPRWHRTAPEEDIAPLVKSSPPDKRALGAERRTSRCLFREDPRGDVGTVSKKGKKSSHGRASKAKV